MDVLLLWVMIARVTWKEWYSPDQDV